MLWWLYFIEILCFFMKSSTNVSATLTSKTLATPSLVSQIIQSGTLLQQQSSQPGSARVMQGLIRVAAAPGQVMLTGAQGQSIRTSTVSTSQGQLRVANAGARGMRVMGIATQGTLLGGGSQQARIVVPDGSIVMTQLPQSVSGKCSSALWDDWNPVLQFQSVLICFFAFQSSCV